MHTDHVIVIAGHTITCKEANPGNPLDHGKRFGRITGSIITCVLGHDRYATDPTLALLKIFQCDGFTGNEHTHRGQAAESFIINKLYTEWRRMNTYLNDPSTITYTGFKVHGVLDFLGTTQDFNVGQYGGGECKFISGKAGPYPVKMVEHDGKPKHVGQCQLQMMCDSSQEYHDLIIAGWKDYAVKRTYKKDNRAWWFAPNGDSTNCKVVMTFYNMYLRWYWEDDASHISYERLKQILAFHKVPKETIDKITERRPLRSEIEHMRAHRARGTHSK